MQVEINNEIIDFKILPSPAGHVSFILDDEEFTFHHDDLKNEQSVFKVYEVNSSRKKELRIYTRSVSSQSSASDNNSLVTAAIISAFKARQQ